jgi:hypothetical protein
MPRPAPAGDPVPALTAKRARVAPGAIGAAAERPFRRDTGDPAQHVQQPGAGSEQALPLRGMLGACNDTSVFAGGDANITMSTGARSGVAHVGTPSAARS